MKSINALPAYRVERAENLIPYVNNPRTHSDAQIAKISASIKEFGFTNPILTDGNNGIVAGHGRLLAAQKLGIAEVPVIDLAYLSDTQRRAYILADNRLALDAGWDDELLRLELGSLRDDDFDLGLTGFDGHELDALFADQTEGLTDPDDAPEAQAEAVSVIGDLWLLGGRHRLACGDSTSVEAVDAALGGVKPHLMVTDPPYGVEYDADWRVRDNPAQYKGGKGTSVGVVQNDNRADWSEVWALFPGDVAYVWHDGLRAGTVADSLAANGFTLRAQIIWVKPQMIFGRGDYHWHHEPCWYSVRNGKVGHYSGDRKQTTVWQIDSMHVMGKGRGGKDNPVTGHSTQKPVECMKRPIENNSSPGQAVYEPFSGSGTTIIAGEMTGRSVHAIELHPQYVDVAVRRWEAFTGQEATLDGDGRTFKELEAIRQPTAG